MRRGTTTAPDHRQVADLGVPDLEIRDSSGSLPRGVQELLPAVRIRIDGKHQVGHGFVSRIMNGRPGSSGTRGGGAVPQECVSLRVRFLPRSAEPQSLDACARGRMHAGDGIKGRQRKEIPATNHAPQHTQARGQRAPEVSALVTHHAVRPESLSQRRPPQQRRRGAVQAEIQIDHPNDAPSIDEHIKTGDAAVTELLGTPHDLSAGFHRHRRRFTLGIEPIPPIGTLRVSVTCSDAPR